MRSSSSTSEQKRGSYAYKKTTHCKSRALSPKRNAQNIYSLKFQYLYKQDTQNLPFSMSIILSLRHQTFNKERSEPSEKV